MNVMLSFPVAEERQVRSIDLKLNFADDIQAGEEGSLTSHSHNVNLWCDLLSCFRCQFLNLKGNSVPRQNSSTERKILKYEVMNCLT